MSLGEPIDGVRDMHYPRQSIDQPVMPAVDSPVNNTASLRY